MINPPFDKEKVRMKYRKKVEMHHILIRKLSILEKEAAYQKEYRRLNKDDLQAYRRKWMRTYRSKKKQDEYVPKRAYSVVDGKRKYKTKRKGFCSDCEIRLDGLYALPGTDEYCGECLTKHTNDREGSYTEVSRSTLEDHSSLQDQDERSKDSDLQTKEGSAGVSEE